MSEVNHIDVSVIIPVYNPGKLIQRCLDSILAQEGEYSYEVILVDDGSTDDSEALILAYQNPHFIFLKQENAGPAAARNKGIAMAKGTFLTFIDADDYWEPSFFKETIGFLDEHQDCLAVSVAQRHLTVSGEFNAPSCYSFMDKSIVLHDFFEFWADWMHVCTGSMMARTDAVKKTGGQRSDLRITEDLEFWALLATQGKWGFIPDILFTSDGTDTIIGRDGWIKKMKIRWANAPTIAEWEKRIVASKPELLRRESYKRARGRISRNLTYSQLLSGRTKLARQDALLYGAYFKQDSMGKLMNFCKKNPLLWWMMCKFLIYREYHR